jgi:hypothetical protein
MKIQHPFGDFECVSSASINGSLAFDRRVHLAVREFGCEVLVPFVKLLAVQTR